MFDHDDFGTLAGAEAETAVSLYLPTHVAGREIRQDPIRLNNLLDEAQSRLVESGIRRSDAEQLLEPARRLASDGDFWRNQAQGLALFLSPRTFQCHRVPLELPERVVIGKRFHLKPLLRLFAADGSFWLLTLTAGQVRLFECSRYGMTERSDADLPESIEEIFAETDYENTLYAHPVARPRAGRPSGVPSTQGLGETPAELHKSQLVEFVRRVATAVDEWLGNSTAPLVLAADAELQGHFRAVARIRSLLPEGIESNPEALDGKVLHERAYALVKPQFESDRLAAVDQFRARQGDGSGRGTAELPAIVRAARYARVDKLLVRDDREVWGRLNDAADEIVAQHDQPETGDEDLLNFAAVQTLRQGGQVYLVEAEVLPGQALAGAVLRF